MASHCTYVYSDPKTGTPVYVGEGRIDRPFDHQKKNYSSQLCRMLRKRAAEGFKPQLQVIPASSKEDGQEMEMLLIAMIGRKDLGHGPLFNHTDGGDGRSGFMWTDEQCVKQSLAQKRRHAKPGAKEAHGLAQKAAHAKMSAEDKAAKDKKISEALKASCASRFRCTVDGVTFYTSKVAMAAELGCGKNGTHSPNFRYV